MLEIFRLHGFSRIVVGSPDDATSPRKMQKPLLSERLCCNCLVAALPRRREYFLIGTARWALRGRRSAASPPLSYFFFVFFLPASSSSAACAAARRATGTRNGEQLT